MYRQNCSRIATLSRTSNLMQVMSLFRLVTMIMTSSLDEMNYLDLCHIFIGEVGKHPGGIQDIHIHKGKWRRPQDGAMD